MITLREICWVPLADSVTSFVLSIIIEVLECESNADGYGTVNPEYIQAILDEAGVDFQRLREPYPFLGGRCCHTCLDMETDTLYVYEEEAEGRLPYLKLFKLDEEE